MRFRGLDGAHLEATVRGIKIGKVMIGLSLVLPYLVNWMNEEQFRQFSIYAPTWVFGIVDDILYGGPTPMAFLMIFYWAPYAFVGYQSFRFAQGRYSSVRWYLAIVAFATLIGILFTLSLGTLSTASSNGIQYFPTVIPLPLISILAIVLIPLLRPTVLESSWDNSKEDVFLQNDAVVSSEVIDSQE